MLLVQSVVIGPSLAYERHRRSCEASKSFPQHDRLVVSDPLAVQHIFANAYRMPKADFYARGAALMTGEGLFVVEGLPYSPCCKVPD